MSKMQPPILSALTPRQSLMWIEDQLYPGIPLNNMVTLLEIDQEIDVELFKKAFSALVSRHEAMRMVVSKASGQFVARIIDEQSHAMELVDFSTVSDSERKYKAWLQNRCRRTFRLNEQLFEAALIKLADKRFVFYINQHHCVTDGRSAQVMMMALDNLYTEQITRGYIAETDGVTDYRSFNDYLRSNADCLNSDRARNGEAFWAERYETPTEPVKFYGRSTEGKTFSTQRNARALSPENSQQILSIKRHTPPSIVLTTVLFAFLRRATGNSDLCIGVPLLNRSKEYVNTLGLFMEISLNRVLVTENDTFATLLEKVRSEVRSTKAHRGHAVTSRNARFEAMLNYRLPADISFCGEPVRFQRLSPLVFLDQIPGDTLPSTGWTTRNSLTVDITFTPAAGEFEVTFDCNTGVWPNADGRDRALNHFICLLEHFLNNQTAPIDALDIVTDPEHKLLLQEWNPTSTVLPQNRCIQRMFEEQVERTPQATALEYAGECVSYRELNRRANRLAHSLINKGVQEDSLVGICLNRSVELIVALLATLKAGGAYVPLDPDYPEKRLQMIWKEATPVLLLTDETLPEILAQAANNDQNPSLPCSPSNLAYVIYTSGSTGKPKGVMIEQHSMVNLIQATQQVLQLTETDRMLSVSSISTDMFTMDTLLPLLTGARMLVASRESIVDGHLLSRKIATDGATHLQATPASWRMLLEADWWPNQPITGVVGGELLSSDLAAQLVQRCERLWCMYGPAEANVWATALAVHNEQYRQGDVGRPLSNYQIYILDKWQKLAPVGVVGELYIGGAGLARGYLNRPDLTADSFMEIEDLGRLYRTGDLGRWQAEGHVEFLGRNDYQVKVRGYRIELGEIEATLLTHESVEEAVVVVHGEGENKQLAAYIRATSASKLNEKRNPRLLEQLRAHLKLTLPQYMLPAAITLLERFPLTPNRKIDRRALPAPELSESTFAEYYVAPKNLLQEKVARIWADVLGVERVGVRDNFLDLGGHSIMAMRLGFKIEDATGIHLQIVDLLRGLTIEEICNESVKDMVRQR